MQLAADQELRRELLLVSLSKRPDLEDAINFAAQMEQFVLRGFCTKHAAIEKVANSAANGAEQSLGATDTSFANPQVKSAGGEMRGNGGARPGANGSTSGSHHSVASSMAGGQKRRWSSGDDERLRKLWHSDHSLEEIAEAMGRTTPSLYSRARALGMAKRAPVGDNRQAARPSRGGREPASGGAAPASASEDDISGKAGQRVHATASRAPTSGFEVRRYSAPCGRDHPGLGSTFSRNGHSARAASPVAHAFQTVPLEAGVEPIIHFLRSRDYSVVRVEDGRFKLDGRHVLDANELREKANKVRQSLGKPPFTPHSYGSPG